MTCLKAKVFCYEPVCLGSGHLQKDKEEVSRSPSHFRDFLIISGHKKI